MKTTQARGANQARKSRPKLSVAITRSASEIEEAQRLRYRIFAGELGARLVTPEPGVDRDRFDPYCEHLVVRDDDSGMVVGTYRILSPVKAREIGGYYSEAEFDLNRLDHLRPKLVEVGRSCVHPDYRSGATIALLWSGLTRYVREHGHEYLFGCASISMADGGQGAASLFRRLGEHLGPLEYRVFPRCPLPLGVLKSDRPAGLPPLIKGYLRAGAYICGEPAWDPDFNTADLPILMPLARVESRYARHFVDPRE